MNLTYIFSFPYQSQVKWSFNNTKLYIDQKSYEDITFIIYDTQKININKITLNL